VDEDSKAFHCSRFDDEGHLYALERPLRRATGPVETTLSEVQRMVLFAGGLWKRRLALVPDEDQGYYQSPPCAARWHLSSVRQRGRGVLKVIQSNPYNQDVIAFTASIPGGATETMAASLFVLQKPWRTHGDRQAAGCDSHKDGEHQERW